MMLSVLVWLARMSPQTMFEITMTLLAAVLIGHVLTKNVGM